MTKELSILKGIHPGYVLEQKINERGLKKAWLAVHIHEYPQTLTAITKGKRDMNTALALKLEKELGLEEGYFMTLQIFYDIKKEKEKVGDKAPDLSQLRPLLFWDTDMKGINWRRQYKAVIRRVFERGNHKEKEEISRFYGKKMVYTVLNGHAAPITNTR